jgi:hypothetical protein
MTEPSESHDRDSSASVSTAHADDHGANAPTAQDGPTKLSALDKQTWLGVLKRTFKQVARTTSRPGRRR